MSFDIFRNLPLDFLGEAWKDCSLTFRYLSITEAQEFSDIETPTGIDRAKAKKLSEQIVRVLERKFVKGTAIRDGKVVEVQAKDLGEMPIEVLNAAVAALVGMDTDKKKV